MGRKSLKNQEAPLPNLFRLSMASIAMEEYSLTKDSKYRSFMLAIDKALRAFDYTTEWADLIAALGKLNKVLLAHMKYPIIPRRILISKRLAQCMHPALPTGVHLKALETYDIIFKSMGTNRLAQELFLYSAGLFPLMGNAAMSVRPQLLTIFETHFVSLGHRLRPGLNGIITGILPGLEEGSDHFDRVINLLISICDACGPIYFYTSIWKCIASNYSIRYPAISFILNQFQRNANSSSSSKQEDLYGKNLDIVGEALCQSVQDTNVLVQRSTLELLTHMFPIHDPKLSNLLLINVMTSSLYVILRRDMSLNRRLFSWLIGHEDNNSNDCMKFTSDNYSYYFQHYTQQCLTESLIQFLKKSVQSPNMDLKPFRLLMTLFEKPVISSFILDDLIIEILRTLYHFDHKYCKSDSNEVAGSSPSAGKSRDDFVRTTNLLLGSFEMQLIWKFCGDYFEKVFKSDFRINDSLIIPVNQIGSSSISVAEISQLIIFLLETLSIDTYVTTHSYELPNLFKKIVNALLIEHKHLKSEEIILTFSACRRILSKVHPIISENMDDISSINDENEPSFESLVYSCSNTFGELFSALFSEYFFSDDNRLECLFLKTCLCITRKSNQQASNLDGMLLEHSTDDDEDENTNVFKVQETDRNFENLLEELKCTCVRTKNNGNDYIDVLTAACNILMDLSSLTLNHPLEIGSNDAEDNNKRNIPLWLMHLILSSCFLHEDFFGFQLHCIETFLLIAGLGDAASNSKRKITLKLVPDSKLKLIAEETVISQIIGWRLWNGLASNGVFDLQCVDLLHKLHIAIPHEDLMEKAMSQISESESLKLDYFKKFTLFWRLSRDIGLKLQDSRIAKIFDFCLYKLLDNLNADIGPLKTQSQCWILHAITHGDILRVFEPLFLQLLNPDSARISVLHAKIYTTDTIDAEKASKAFKRMDLYQNTTVYAIHPREGDIKYHISGDLSELNQSKKMKHALYLSSFEDKKSCSEDIFSKTENFNLSTLSSNILVNPFALVPNSCNSHSSYTFGFSHDEPNSCIVDNIIDDILEDVVDTNSTSSETSSLSNSVVVHPLHSHILIYTQVFDSKLILYTLKCIKNIILTNPRVIVCTLSTSNLSSVKSLRNNDLQNLLAKHRKSIFGNNFFGRISDEDLKTYRNASLIEIMMSLCLYFIRSYYPNLGYTRLTPEEIVGNRNIQLLSVEIMVMIVSELIHLVSVNGKAYASFVNDLLNRFKVQKIILHSLLTSVHDSNRYSKKQNTYFTDEILNFNNVGCDNVSFDLYLATYNEAFQVQILKLTLSTMMLEQSIFQERNLDNTVIDSNHERKRSIVSLLSMKYVNDLSIPEQPLFLTAIISALSQSKIRHIHSYWTSFVISSLPFLGESLNYIVSEVMGQIIANVEEIILKHHPDKLPTDYIVNQIEALTAIIHYCLVDVSSDSKPFDTKSTQYIDSGTIFNNLLHAFSSKSNNSGMGLLGNNSKSNIEQSQKSLLSNLPTLLACVMKIWNVVTNCQSTNDVKHIKESLLDLFSPIAHHYASHFVSAVAITWQEIKCVEKVVVSFPEAPNSGHEVLINFVESVHTMPISNIINTLRSIIKSPPLVIGVKWKNDIQVLVLQFFYSYMSKFSALALSDSWTELALLTKECLGLNPPAIFLSLAILNQFVLRGKKMSEKKDVKEIQDLAGKIVDQCAAIGGSRLETKTWLQRNFVMSRDVQVLPESNEKDKNDSNSTNALHPYAVTALNLLGDILANFLDVIYQSDEKEKVLPLLQTVMSNVIPYTRNHTQTNRNCFIACSRLLSGLSEYQYTRKAWRKEVFELLMEPSFFQMDYECFPYWKVIVDNMMTHDNTTFKELMTKLGSIGQSGSLNLFTNKDAEIEQKALCLKRLAFVIFCADTDQYYRYMPDIQERLAECLRMVSNTPEIQSVVFLCFRVILLRMSQQHLTSLWPLIITEMVQIFSYMEHELSTDTEEWSSHLKQMSLLDTGWVMTSGSNSLEARNSPTWLDLYLSACKLLDLTLVLPAQRVPQFQMYRWAFINEGGEGLLSSQSNVDEDAIEISNSLDFVPYVVRVAKLLITPDKQVEPFIRVKGSPLLTMKSISSLNNLRPFFNAVCLGNSPQKAIKLYNSPSDINEKAIDDILIKDFIESFVPLKVAG